MKKPQLRMTPDELTVVELCLRTLTEEEIANCRARITENVMGELQHEDYEALLVETMVSLLKRHVRELRLDQILKRDGLKQGRRSLFKSTTAKRRYA